MRILLIGNLSDTRCGFANFTQQMATALPRDASVSLTVWDGTYSEIYRRREAGTPTFWPEDIETYDVIHLIWHAMTLNHYSGADWASLKHPIVSWWDGGPSDASCPFLDWMQVRWSDYPREGYEYSPYPVPDWVTDLPQPDPVFTVGASSVRGDGVAEIQQICEQYGWAMNLPTPGVWRSLEEEIRRLARSTVNVCWYRTPPLWKNRASAPSMLLASKRPLLINRDDLVAHLWEAEDVYHGKWGNLEPALGAIYWSWAHRRPLKLPLASADSLSWTRATAHFLAVWETARRSRVWKS
jgi:hypothetical protein